jgi:hypothetical protein
MRFADAAGIQPPYAHGVYFVTGHVEMSVQHYVNIGRRSSSRNVLQMKRFSSAFHSTT